MTKATWYTLECNTNCFYVWPIFSGDSFVESRNRKKKDYRGLPGITGGIVIELERLGPQKLYCLEGQLCEGKLFTLGWHININGSQLIKYTKERGLVWEPFFFHF